MDKTYLLLRNNQESGPYNLDELQSIQLNERDLVWVEGESITWTKPSSIEALQANSKQTITVHAESSFKDEPLQKRKKPVNKYLVALTIMAGAFSGWMLAKGFHEQDKIHIAAAAAKPGQQENDQHYISSTTTEESQPVAITPSSKEEIKFEKTIATSPPPKDEPILIPTSEEEETRPEVENEATDKTAANKEENAEPKKKNIFKKLGDWLKAGKELDEEKNTEERQVNIKESVTVSVIASDNNWMMGIKGQQVKVFNRSNARLQFGKVELHYYSEQNSILDKKTIDIPTIEPGKSKSLSIPDHKLADRVEAIVVDAVGLE